MSDLTIGLKPEQYFAIARERETIRRKRLAGEPWPWTKDKVFQQYRFTNVHREHDITTVWLRENIREPLATASKLRQTEAILAFRWFNLISTGEVIKDILLSGWNSEAVLERLKDKHPVVTGAYMIRTEVGMTKAEGVCYCIEKAIPKLKEMVPRWGKSIRQTTLELTEIHGLGPFLAYEIATDLRWTSVLNSATDIMTYANAGPGCAHGLSRLYDIEDPWRWNRGKDEHQVEMNEVMQYLLALSKHQVFWPQEWDPWEMREVEMWACEWDKWCRGQQGLHLKRRYSHE